jgi:hypothetical protein
MFNYILGKNDPKKMARKNPNHSMFRLHIFPLKKYREHGIKIHHIVLLFQQFFHRSKTNFETLNLPKYSKLQF